MNLPTQSYVIIVTEDKKIINIPFIWLIIDTDDTPIKGVDYEFYWPLHEPMKEAEKNITVKANWLKKSGKLLNIAGNVK